MAEDHRRGPGKCPFHYVHSKEIGFFLLKIPFQRGKTPHGTVRDAAGKPIFLELF